MNILLNVVTSDMQSGWEFVYNILEISDSEDKQLPINIISRLVNDIGLHRLAAVGKLHSLCLKEMKICGDGLLLGRLVDLVWVVAKHINLWTAWLETIRSIKDIYKMTLSTPLLQLFYRICNQCILQRQTKAVSIASPASEQFNEEN